MTLGSRVKVTSEKLLINILLIKKDIYVKKRKFNHPPSILRSDVLLTGNYHTSPTPCTPFDSNSHNYSLHANSPFFPPSNHLNSPIPVGNSLYSPPDHFKTDFIPRKIDFIVLPPRRNLIYIICYSVCARLAPDWKLRGGKNRLILDFK